VAAWCMADSPFSYDMSFGAEGTRLRDHRHLSLGPGWGTHVKRPADTHERNRPSPQDDQPQDVSKDESEIDRILADSFLPVTRRHGPLV